LDYKNELLGKNMVRCFKFGIWKSTFWMEWPFFFLIAYGKTVNMLILTLSKTSPFNTKAGFFQIGPTLLEFTLRMNIVHTKTLHHFCHASFSWFYHHDWLFLYHSW
jgi:hypothetical protein